MNSSVDNPERKGRAYGVAVGALGVLAVMAPLGRAEPEGRIGLLLILSGALEAAHGFRRATDEGRRSAWFGGVVTLAMGGMLINAPYLASQALLWFLAGWFGIDAVRYLAQASRHVWKRQAFAPILLKSVGNAAVALGVVLVGGKAMPWTVALAGGLRIFGAAWNIWTFPVFDVSDSGETVAADLALPDDPELRALAARLSREESARASIDRGWIVGYMATLLAIHVSRMGLDRTFLGIASPAFAVLGDLFFALLTAFAVVIPALTVMRRLTRGPERLAWKWCLRVPEDRRGWPRRAAQAGLTRRLRSSIRLRGARYSFRSALSRGLQIGLPLAAIVAASVPVWGMSWYFDTENWAAGAWNSWAEERTDIWREAMIKSVHTQGSAAAPDQDFAVDPPGVSTTGDFSFIVIGDTGEGDASQLSLKDQFLNVVKTDDVKFVVLSSDVVYPTGAMRDYEAKFWLPFMGTAKPIYAIPGNHDWYDALEGFAATFLEPSAARSAMRARIEADNRLTSTTDARIEELIATASRLGREYRVPTQRQRAPFFQIQTEKFALFAVDTGVARSVDPAELAWLKAALESSRGKTKMAVLGHPLYAGGHYLGEGSPDFAALHALLREHEVAIIMAGDTHDLERYVETAEGSRKQALHIVNGGGGAYLSFGTALDWPAQPATKDWAYYPSRAEIVAKIEATTPLWKRPAWWWTDRFGGWPFSAEWLSAAFDSNVAPFFQSFIEVRVEPSKGQIRLLPHGVHGPLTWRDLQSSAGAPPGGADPSSRVEWIVKMQ